MRITNDYLHSIMLKTISETFVRRRETIHGLWKNEKTITISFDCDYDRDMISCVKVLEALREKCVPSSFALIGKLALRFPEVVNSILTEGHEIINHTYNHKPEFRKLPAFEKFEEISLFQELMKDNFGITVKGFRAPHLRMSRNKELFGILKNLSLFDSSLLGSGIEEIDGVVEIPLTPFPDIKRTPFCTYQHFRMPFISSSKNGFLRRWELLLTQNNFINVFLDPIDVTESDDLLRDLISLASNHDFTFSTLEDVSRRPK